MNGAQLSKYWPEWKKAKDMLMEQEKSGSECEAIRKKIHFQRGAFFVVNNVLKIKSSNRLTNKQFDAILADFLAIYAGDDLGAQLDLLSQPEKRILFATAKLLDKIGIDEDCRAKYVEGVARKPLMDCDENDIQRIVIALNHTAMHKTGKEHNHPRVGKGPISKYAHRVGHNKDRQSQPATTERIQDEALETAPF